MNHPLARVLCVDDHPVVRAGLRAMIDLQPRLSVVGEAADAAEARTAVATLDPDIVVMDVRLGSSDGIALTADLVRANPALRIVILSSYAGDEEVHRALDAGARGYVLKEFAAAEILAALDQVRRGNPYLSRDIADRLARTGPRVHLTPREHMVLVQMAGGRDDNEIAAAGTLSIAEVEACIARLVTKFGCTNRVHLTVLATARGFLNSTVELQEEHDLQPRAPRGGLAQWQLKRAQQYMELRIEEDVPLADVAASVRLSSFHFARAFKQTVGLPPHAWLTALRMRRAIELMQDHPQMNLAEIALRVGYQSQAAFGNAFRRHHGEAPNQWRRRRMIQ